MEVAQKYGLVCNPKKTKIKAPVLKFLGFLYGESGVYQDPEKVDAVHALPTPTNITELQEFLGIVTYLSPFIPGLSTLTAPCVSYSRRMLNSAGMPPIKQLFNVLRILLIVTLPFNTLMPHAQ